MDFNGLRSNVASNPVVRGIAQGTVSGTKTVTVKIGGRNVVCDADRALTTAAGDIVYGVRIQGRILIIGRLYAGAPDPPDEGSGLPPFDGGTVYGETVILPVETRSYSNGSWIRNTADVFYGIWSGHNRKGCIFYGKKPRSLSGATVTRARVTRLHREDQGSDFLQNASIRRFTQTVRPAGDVTLTGSTENGPRMRRGEELDEFVLPSGWGQEFVDGLAGGFALYNPTPETQQRFSGMTYSAGWTLFLEWQRTT